MSLSRYNDIQGISEQLFIDVTAHPYHITIAIIQLQQHRRLVQQVRVTVRAMFVHHSARSQT